MIFFGMSSKKLVTGGAIGSIIPAGNIACSPQGRVL